MKTLGSVLYRLRWAVVGVALVATLLAALYGQSLFGVLRSGGYNDPSSPSSVANQILIRHFNNASTDVLLILRSDHETATSPAFVRAATRLIKTLRQQPAVASVSSYYSTRDPGLLSRHRHATVVSLVLAARTSTGKAAAYQRLEPLIRAPGLTILPGGVVPTNVALNRQTTQDLKRVEMITLPLVVVLLVVVFGGLVAAALPLITGGIAIALALALLKFLTQYTPISVFAVNVVTMLGLGLAIDYALFIISRFREELVKSPDNVPGAVGRTMATAGRTVLFSGLTVAIGLLGLLLFPEYFLRSMGLGVIGAVLMAMLSALLLLPALLAILGFRINWLRVPGLKPLGAAANDTRGFWYHLSQVVMRRPAPVLAITLGGLLLLGSPFLRVQFAIPDQRVLPVGSLPRLAAGELARNFPKEGASELTVAVQAPGDMTTLSSLTALSDYTRKIAAIPGVVRVSSVLSLIPPNLPPSAWPRALAALKQNPRLAPAFSQYVNHNVTRITVALNSASLSPASETVLSRIRALPMQGGLAAWVDGLTADQVDMLSSIGHTLPGAVAIVALATVLLLWIMTRSVIIPLKAIILSALSLTATFGALVWIFQDGHLSGLLGFSSTGNISPTEPILIFAIAFGLSMDYEVFLISRIKEEYDTLGDNREAVARGLQHTGWLITSAALLLASVVGAFASSRIIMIQEIGLGLALAVIMDATIIRALLVPAFMRLIGRWNWWSPRLLPGSRPKPARTRPEEEPSR